MSFPHLNTNQRLLESEVVTHGSQCVWKLNMYSCAKITRGRIAVSHGIRITTSTTSAALFSSAIIDLSKNDRDMEELANHVLLPSLRPTCCGLLCGQVPEPIGNAFGIGKTSILREFKSLQILEHNTSRLLVFTTLLDKSLILGSGEPASRPYLAAERVHATL